MVLGLLVMSSAAFVLSVTFRKDPDAPPDVPKAASTHDRHRTHIPVSGAAAPPAGEATAESVGAAVHSLGPGLLGCVDAWSPDLAAYDRTTQTIEVQLGSAGIERADLLDARGLPVGFLGCLGAALREAPWPGGGEDTLLVRVPLPVSLKPQMVERGKG